MFHFFSQPVHKPKQERVPPAADQPLTESVLQNNQNVILSNWWYFLHFKSRSLSKFVEDFCILKKLQVAENPLQPHSPLKSLSWEARTTKVALQAEWCIGSIQLGNKTLRWLSLSSRQRIFEEREARDSYWQHVSTMVTSRTFSLSDAKKFSTSCSRCWLFGERWLW